MYIYVYSQIHVYIHVCTCICVYIYIYIYTHYSHLKHTPTRAGRMSSLFLDLFPFLSPFYRRLRKRAVVIALTVYCVKVVCVCVCACVCVCVKERERVCVCASTRVFERVSHSAYVFFHALTCFVTCIWRT